MTYPRSIFTTANKYQNQIILLSFFPSSLVFFTFVFMVIVANPVLLKAVFHTSFPGQKDLINLSFEVLIILICALFMLSLIMAFALSRKMVGGFERTLNELDEIIAGKSKEVLIGRSNDSMTMELLKPVNVLIKHYVKTSP